MKNLFFVLSIVLQSLILVGQQLNVGYEPCSNCYPNDRNSDTIYTYGARAVFGTSDISSDYGRRNCTACSDWHLGVDYTRLNADADIGDHLLNIEEGDIVALRAGGGNYKYIIVESDDYSFGYGHIFRNGNTYPMQSGGLFLWKGSDPTTPNPNDYRYAILSSTLGYGWATWEDTIQFSSNSYIIQNSLVQNHVLAPIGRSSTTNVHLHLYSFVDPSLNFVANSEGGRCNGLINVSNAKDPLEFIEHDIPDYGIDFFYKSANNQSPYNYLSGIKVVYPGNLNSKLMVRTEMQGEGNNSTYNNAVMNVDFLEIYMKLANENENQYSFIRGEKFESKFQLGARLDTERYPIRGVPASNVSVGNSCCIGYIDIACTNQRGSWIQNGVNPYAYRSSGGRPYDEFYYTDFITRIHRNDPMDGDTTPTMIANCPQNARYNDGRYQLKARVVDVRGGYLEGPRNDDDELAPLEFVLDNFKPFIESIEISFGV